MKVGFIALLVFQVFSVQLWANPKTHAKADLKKEMRFRDQVVNGKYQLPGESSIEIENEKPAFNLIQLRMNFKDRRAKETTRD